MPAFACDFKSQLHPPTSILLIIGHRRRAHAYVLCRVCYLRALGSGGYKGLVGKSTRLQRTLRGTRHSVNKCLQPVVAKPGCIRAIVALVPCMLSRCNVHCHCIPGD
jgi:hypothetical protein